MTTTTTTTYTTHSQRPSILPFISYQDMVDGVFHMYPFSDAEEEEDQPNVEPDTEPDDEEDDDDYVDLFEQPKDDDNDDDDDADSNSGNENDDEDDLDTIHVINELFAYCKKLRRSQQRLRAHVCEWKSKHQALETSHQQLQTTVSEIKDSLEKLHAYQALV